MKASLEQLNTRRLRSYTEDPGLLKEHHGIEQTVLAGGYGYRQILELVQNGADAILEAQEQGLAPPGENRIVVLLRKSRLYVANTGARLSEEGLDALLRSHSSPKRGRQIGRFGLGFKSLLRLEGHIDLFTAASGAIRGQPPRENCLFPLMQYRGARIPTVWRSGAGKLPDHSLGQSFFNVSRDARSGATLQDGRSPLSSFRMILTRGLRHPASRLGRLENLR
jgi:hypothetical protein